MRIHASCFAALMALSAAPLAAQPPQIANGRVTAEAAGSPLRAAFQALVNRQTEPGWVGYSVPAVAGDRTMCCFDSRDGTSFVTGRGASSNGACCGTCRLERSSDGNQRVESSDRSGMPQGGPIRLESPGRLTVLFRVAARAVERIRVFSEDCALDAGGRPVIWLTGVNPVESVALLETFAVPGPERRGDSILDGAVTAIALHGDRTADAALTRLVSADRPEEVRRKVTFWLGHARGAHGLSTLQRVLRDDPSMEVRKGAVFGVSQSPEPGAFDVLAKVARTDPEPRIRSEGVFWLSQQGHQRASGIISEALEKDPAPEVRKKAVFALSQLKNDAGVTPLIGIAKTSGDAAVRGEAIFWLGQKAGARAAQAITDRIEQDPDTEVKKRAVFALSQMPPSEGVPLLINVARTNPTPAVRKQAMFWLGQSRDPRAISFFEEILTRR